MTATIIPLKRHFDPSRHNRVESADALLAGLSPAEREKALNMLRACLTALAMVRRKRKSTRPAVDEAGSPR
jgi:hypothetical protein